MTFGIQKLLESLLGRLEKTSQLCTLHTRIMPRDTQTYILRLTVIELV